MKFLTNLNSVFKILYDKEAYFGVIDGNSKNLLFNQLVIISSLAFLIGMVMGSYHSLAQSISSALKLVCLQISVLIICFPSFYVVQRVMGSKMKLTQMAMIIMSGLVLTTSIILSFAPIVIFFMIIGSKYHFIQLLHVAVFLFGGFFGLRLMLDFLKYACEKKNIYPKTGVSVFKVWIVVMAFVSVQLSWNLRPFVAEKNQDFKVLGDYKGNFYTAVVYSMGQLLSESPDNQSNEKDAYLPMKDQNIEQNKSIDSEKKEDIKPVDFE